MKILAVDDQDAVLQLLKASLAVMGHDEVHTASSAPEALDLIKQAQEPFDCFLLDIEMPGTDGIELVSLIRAIRTYRHTPIIMLTSMREKTYIDAAFGAGATDYVTKPFDGTELAARIRVASIMVGEQRALNDKALAVDILKDQVETASRFELPAAVEIQDVPGTVSALVLENYLLQLSRGRMYGMAAIGFRIVNAEALYRASTAVEFYYMLTDVADAIASHLKQAQFLMAYFGNGIFVATLPRRNPISLEELRWELQLTIDGIGLTHDDGRPMPVTIAVGDQIGTSLLSSSPRELLAKAQDSVAGRGSDGSSTGMPARSAVNG
ncbi:two-component system response regulator [Maritimibacter sp. 55A14]|uniref:response regulator n=1 Tax=Maritimibacter sp. 55A14 TaxID=2174844 RepID=UPI000D61D052|nr:response regulator [Maritimibacter sp. 55A14]PWE31431.1 two-component system response regulator [Maritimibacter sp. 55A14]